MDFTQFFESNDPFFLVQSIKFSVHVRGHINGAQRRQPIGKRLEFFGVDQTMIVSVQARWIEILQA
ncbi:hypothetical protein H663_001800 [Limnohabitans planktonicus II-D5]|uniref:Uncharacterized protein n=1 Tax=Limnohabitans planktonicus II-D5 TaxID=1293045 RepID=A0A2T7UHR3_9BURK|nr:hypothetical protein H663_001800 [Limnohabitans planktonicus II-D5]